ncbi:MAG: hypothetical protein LBP53_05590 [Candidatus Peribacteria bacterium]|nr:hypothetical protein [Candidatus Peribacteria bacterium]
MRKLASSLQGISQPSIALPQREQHDPFFDQQFLDAVQTLRENASKEGEQTQAKISQLLALPAEEEIPYYLQHFFDQWSSEEVDMEYVIKIGVAFPQYQDNVQQIVNTYTESFSYEQMDVIDQAIFLLGYTEYQVLQTPKEILINEMVELAKRYSDEGAPKLINGIMHKVMNEKG